jgi:hypothetical protein
MTLIRRVLLFIAMNVAAIALMILPYHFSIDAPSEVASIESFPT